MTPEQRAREEELAAFIRANGEYLAGVDAVDVLPMMRTSANSGQSAE